VLCWRVRLADGEDSQAGGLWNTSLGLLQGCLEQHTCVSLWVYVRAAVGMSLLVCCLLLAACCDLVTARTMRFHTDASIQFTSYLFLAVGKSCKLVPVMAFNFFINHTKLTSLQVAAVGLISAGTSPVALVFYRRIDQVVTMCRWFCTFAILLLARAAQALWRSSCTTTTMKATWAGPPSSARDLCWRTWRLTATPARLRYEERSHLSSTIPCFSPMRSDFTLPWCLCVYLVRVSCRILSFVWWCAGWYLQSWCQACHCAR